MSIGQPAEVVRAVETGEADFAVISWDHRGLPDSVDAEVLRREPIRLYMTAACAPAQRSMSAAAAMSLPLVGPRRNIIYNDLIEQMRATAHVEPNFVVRLGHAEAIKQAAIEHDWALFCPAYAVEREVAEGLLVSVDVPDLLIEEQLVLLSRHDHLFSPLQQAAANAVRALLSRPDLVALG